jgi:nicotinamidase-related amidase
MSTTALLIIDVQRGAFDAARCPPIDSAGRLIGNALALLQAARAAGRVVAFIQHCDGPDEPFEEGSVHGQLHESLVPAAGEVVVKKHASSAFEGTDLQQQLQSRGVKNLVVCGLQSEFCISNTTRSALDLGYRVTVANDGHSTWPSNGKSAAQIADEVNRTLAGAGARLETTLGLEASLREA